MKIRINKEKSIGKVIYIVEGTKDEPKLLTDIFHKILGFNVVSYNKLNDEIIKITSDANKYSIVYIIPAKESAISSLDINDDYFNSLFIRLIKYDLEIDNSAIYFIYDRDRKSNRPGAITKNMNIFKNSRDNGNYRNGLFLLDYPSIEAFYVNCKKDKNEFSSGKEIKDYILDKEIDINSLYDGTNYLLDEINKIIEEAFDTNMLDKFSDTNLKIFNFEEKYYNTNRKYKTLALIILSLIDLEIISIE